ncbi:MAG: hypothetical protein HY594_02270 [Candidatus Omnitrophica bacterium]|nr:hypothetical protein [Candidatus Omnitrophota bacterium]
MSSKKFPVGRFLKTLLIIPIGIQPALPSPLLAMRFRQEDASPRAAALRQQSDLVGLEETLNPAVQAGMEETLIQRLTARNFDTRNSAVSEFKNLAPAATENFLLQLAGLLADPNDHIRWSALYAVGALGPAAATENILLELAKLWNIPQQDVVSVLESFGKFNSALQQLATTNRPRALSEVTAGVELELAPPVGAQDDEVRSVPTTDLHRLQQDLSRLIEALRLMRPLLPKGYYLPLHLNVQIPPSLRLDDPLRRLLYLLVAPNNPLGRNEYNLDRWYSKEDLQTIKTGDRPGEDRLELKDPSLGPDTDIDYWMQVVRFVHHLAAQPSTSGFSDQVEGYLKAIEDSYLAFRVVPLGTQGLDADRQQLKSKEQEIEVEINERTGEERVVGLSYDLGNLNLRKHLMQYMAVISGGWNNPAAGLEESKLQGAWRAVAFGALLALGVYMQAPDVRAQTAAGDLVSGREPLAAVVAQQPPEAAPHILTRALEARVLSPGYRGPSGKDLVEQLLVIDPSALASYLSDRARPIESRMELIQHLALVLKTESYPVVEDALLRVMRGLDPVGLRRAAVRVLYHAAWDNWEPCMDLVRQDPVLLRAVLSDAQPSEDSLAMALASAQYPDRQIRRLAAARIKRAWISGSVRPGIYSATLGLSRDPAIDAATRRFLRAIGRRYDTVVPTRVKFYSYPNAQDPSGYVVMAGRIHLGVVWYDGASRAVVFGNLLGSRKFLRYALDGSAPENRIRKKIEIEVAQTVGAYRAAGVDITFSKERAWTLFCQNSVLRMIGDLREGRGPMAQKPLRRFNYSRIVPGSRVTSPFGAPRSGGGAHEGVDLAAAAGTPVRAAGDGVVAAVGPKEESGFSTDPAFGIEGVLPPELYAQKLREDLSSSARGILARSA